MCHRDDSAAEKVLTVHSFCRSSVKFSSLQLIPFQTSKYTQFHIHSRTSVHLVTHSHVLIALVTIRGRSPAPLLHQSLINIPSSNLAYGLPSWTLTSSWMGSGSHSRCITTAMHWRWITTAIHWRRITTTIHRRWITTMIHRRWITIQTSQTTTHSSRCRRTPESNVCAATRAVALHPRIAQQRQPCSHETPIQTTSS